jgi:hypothetical protein
MINTTLPLEGAPLAIAGPYKVNSEPAQYGMSVPLANGIILSPDEKTL